MSRLQSISRMEPRPIRKDDPAVAGQRRAAGPIFQVIEKWCRKDSQLKSNARHVLIHIAKRM